MKLQNKSLKKIKSKPKNKVKTKKKIKGGATAPLLPIPLPVPIFTIKKTENDFLPTDRKVRLCLCHGLTIPTSFDLTKGNNVIFIVNS
jgi:hypothetical protein